MTIISTKSFFSRITLKKGNEEAWLISSPWIPTSLKLLFMLIYFFLFADENFCSSRKLRAAVKQVIIILHFRIVTNYYDINFYRLSQHVLAVHSLAYVPARSKNFRNDRVRDSLGQRSTDYRLTYLAKCCTQWPSHLAFFVAIQTWNPLPYHATLSF